MSLHSVGLDSHNLDQCVESDIAYVVIFVSQEFA